MIRQILFDKQVDFPLNIRGRAAFFTLILSILFFLIILVFFQFTIAQEVNNQNEQIKDKPISGDIYEQIREIENSIKLSEEQNKKLRKKMEEISRNRTELTAELIASAQRVKLAEIEVSAIEENLANLLAQQKIIEKRLDGTNEDIANILAALQRLGRSPAPALLIDPTDALSSARSAMLISAILPQLHLEAQNVRKDLQELNIIRQKAFDEEDKFRANLEILAQEQLRIALLIEAREKELASLKQQMEQGAIKKQQLSEQVKSLEELIKNNNEQQGQQNNAQNAVNLQSLEAQMPPSTPKEIALAYANLKRSSPAIPFEKSKGYLALPAAGVIVSKFGDDDGFAGKSKGISIVTRAQAQVIAPNDGWVVYKGPYLDYGQIIIMNLGNDYTILLAGMEKTNVELGQFVLRGEPIGIMGSRNIARAIINNSSISRPTLYVELRKQDIPFNPKEWWADKGQINQTG